MKRYVSCFLFFICLTMSCLLALFFVTRGMEIETEQTVQATESLEEPVFADETEESLVHVVLNQADVEAQAVQEQYYLVAEEGYLIVYDGDEEAVQLFTHMPLAEFPVAEQEKLMEGIWFGTMAEIFSYLESYSS